MKVSSVCLCACVLFVLLSPGVVLTLPPLDGRVVTVNSGRTGIVPVVVHALVFCVALSYLCKLC